MDYSSLAACGARLLFWQKKGEGISARRRVHRPQPRVAGRYVGLDREWMTTATLSVILLIAQYHDRIDRRQNERSTARVPTPDSALLPCASARSLVRVGSGTGRTHVVAFIPLSRARLRLSRAWRATRGHLRVLKDFLRSSIAT